MADIAINPVVRRVQFTGNTGLGPFAFTFNILQNTDIVVYKNRTLLTLTTDYTVTINANGTGSVTLTGSGSGTALVADDVFTLIGGRELSRTTDFVTAGDLLASSLNEQLDSNVIMSQQLDERFSRTIRVNPGDADKTLEVPSIAERADKILKFDSSGNIAVESASALAAGAVVGANFVNNTFTGNGSQTAFTTTVEAGSKNNAQVYIDGVYQLKSSFSVSGTTLTFTEAPPLNSQIEVIIGNAIDTLDADSGNINYNQGSTGAQTRTVENKLQEFVSVKDFGAIGDGVTDDTAAIQAAIDSKATNKGVKVIFPKGIYKVTSSLDIQNSFSVALVGESPANTFQGNSSAQIKWTSGAGTGPVINAAGARACEIANLSFYASLDAYDGSMIDLSNGASNPSGIWIHDCVFFGDTASSSIAQMINLSTALETTIERCFFRYGVYQIKCANASINSAYIRDCWFQEATTAAIGLQNANGMKIDSNVFETIDIGAIKATGSVQGLVFSGNWTGDTLSASTMIAIDLSSATGSGINIVGNILIGNTNSTAIKLNSSAHALYGVTISGNLIGGGTGINGGYVNSTSIINNEFRDCSIPFTYTEMVQSVWSNNVIDTATSGAASAIGKTLANDADMAISLVKPATAASGVMGDGIYNIHCRSTSGANIGIAAYSLNGSQISVTKLFESVGSTFTTTYNNATTINVYWDAATTTYRVQNKTGADIKVIVNSQTII